METYVLIFKRLQRLLGNFLLFILSYRAWLPSLVLSCHVLFWQMPRTRASVSSGRGEVVPEVVGETLTRGRGRARAKGRARGVAPSRSCVHEAALAKR
ncbi:hypothetical protein KY290_007985 [Solanum tuberosum]|uniref:Uncharacterized protein n=1 Tax=Solanum tuberosum TaxID=4113 RepID=A0ABQ7W7A0_SOLTU|nr:hypothetical protein KY290_007985 [Solanum tuberosum]